MKARSRSAKRSAGPHPAPPPPPPLHMKVTLLSGQTIPNVEVTASWTLVHLKEEAQKQLGAECIVSSVLVDDKELTDEETTLADLGLQGARVVVVTRAVPRLHVFEPCSAKDFARRFDKHDGWETADPVQVSLRDDVRHAPMEEAPGEALQIAQKMAQAAPNLSETVMMKAVANDYLEEKGEIFVISNPTTDLRQTCLEALGYAHNQELYDASVVKNKPWRNWLDGYVCMFDDNDDDEDKFEPHPNIIAMANIMADSLSQHFKFYVFMSEDSDPPLNGHVPVMFGGFASDGAIVGLVSTAYVMY